MIFFVQLLVSCKPSVVIEETVISAYDENHDYDGDGQSEAEGDCNDLNPEINTNAEEICDQIDNDCDGRVDDNTIDGIGWYLDVDGDGYGREEFYVTSCTASPGYVRVQKDEDGMVLFDCDDNNPLIYPTAPEVCDNQDNDCDDIFDDLDPSFVGDAYWYRDSDRDGFGISEIQKRQCAQPLGFIQGPETLPPEQEDCDDLNPAVHPESNEVCDGIDNDCDGRIDDDDPNGMSDRIWTIDADGDGYGASGVGAEIIFSCEGEVGYVLNTDDCDDQNPLVYPDAEEICDGLDQNCDGVVDEDVQIAFYLDADGDGYGASTSVMEPLFGCEENPPSGYVANFYDCDDTNAEVNPDFLEKCDEVDNNCDGLIDEETAIDVSPWYFDGDLDGYGDANEEILACEAPPYHVANADDCDDSDSARNPGEIEICSLNPVNFQHRDEDCSGSDNDPNQIVYAGGSIFYRDTDQDGYGIATDFVYACYAEELYTALQTGDCNDGDGDISPAAVETCSGSADENCDGQVNEVGADECSYYFYDFDNDGYGISAQSACICSASGYFRASFGGDCDDQDSLTSPSVGTCGLMGDVAIADAEVVISGRETDASSRKDLIGNFDYNADGIPDIAVVDPGYDPLLGGDIQTDAGALFLYLGPLSQDKDVNNEADADLIFSTASAGEALGIHGVSVGNWDADPEMEIVINGVLDSFLLQSGLEGQGIITDFHPDVSRLPNRSGGGLDAIQSIGDVNGDGLVDVVSNYDQLFYGVETLPGAGVDSFLYADSEMFCSSPTLRQIGTDLNGDGLQEWVGVDDFALSIRTYDSAQGIVELGSIPSVVDRYDGRVEQGDFNGDGYADIVASNSNATYYEQTLGDIASTGMAHLFYGSVDGITALGAEDAGWGIRGEVELERMGIQLVSVDFDGDGVDDLLTVSKGGSSSLFYGPLTFPSNAYGGSRLALATDADVIFEDVDSAAANAGDQNQDGAEDLLIRVRDGLGYDVYLFHGALNF